jgi:lauroyl/myristoyl acyltransferase
MKQAALAGKLIERIVSVVPPATAYRIASPVSRLFLRGKTQRLLEDTRTLFPDRPEAWIRDAVRRQRHHRAWVAVDKYMLTRLSGPEVVAMHDADDVRRISALAEEERRLGSGGIIYTLHYGRPAWSPFLFSELGFPYVGLMRGSGDTGLQEQHASAARARGASLVEAGDLAAGVHAMRGLKENKFLFTLIDGRLTQRPTLVEFLGVKVPFSLGFVQLARRTGSGLVAGVTSTGADPTKLRINAVRVEMPPADLSPEEIGRRLVAPLEEMVLRDVGQWYGINRLFRQARRFEREPDGER